MKLTLKEIATIIDGQIQGDENLVITGISGIKEAKPGDITFLANKKYVSLIEMTQASAIITSFDVSPSKKTLVKTQNPSLAFAQVVGHFAPSTITHPQGIHETAVISPKATIAANVAVGAHTIIEAGVTIEEGTIVYGNCYIGNDSKIGKNCLIYPLVSIRERTEVGNSVIIHSGAVIGSDGFGFANVKGIQEKIPQIGIVCIEDNVEIGANVTIDRARFDKTLIGKGTKIDNLVQIAHNVQIGEDALIVAQAGISGSTVVGKKAVLAGQVGVVGHITIGEGAVCAAQAGVTKSVPPHIQVSGYPAKPHDVALRVNACVQRLPELYKRIKELEKELTALKERVNNGETTNY